MLADAVEIPDARVAAHVAACETCQATMMTLRDTVNALRSDVAGADQLSPSCLDEDAIAAFVGGSAAHDEQRGIISHLAACARCCREVSSLARAMRDPSVATELKRLRRAAGAPRSRWLARVGVAAGLAAVLALIIVQRADLGRSTEEATYREQSRTDERAAIVVAPVGPVTVADTLRWRSVSRADSYGVTMFSPAGVVIWKAQTRDTVIAIPREIAQTLHGPQFWKVAARTGWNRSVESDLIEFTVAGPRRSRP